jgi:VanZ family protein
MARTQAARNQPSGLALPLALVYCGLVAYASLYPFLGWRSQGVMPWAFAASALPKYWSGFDVAINFLGYVPLGFLVAVAVRAAGKPYPAWLAGLFACALSFLMEALQTYLPLRVTSNVDWALNSLGGLAGGLLAWLFHALGLLQSWSRFRQRRFVLDSGVTLGLLLLWPLALLYPTPIPLGLGYGFGQWLEIDNQAPTDTLSSTVLALGFLTPLLMAYAVTPRIPHRIAMLVFLALATLGVTTLSHGLSFGPEHAALWLHEKSLRGLWIAAGVGVALIIAPPRLAWVLAFMCLMPYLLLVNIMADNPYFAQTLAIWDQGRFIRFYGATQWLGLLWPYAALWLVALRISKLK